MTDLLTDGKYMNVLKVIIAFIVIVLGVLAFNYVLGVLND